ncbi:hypothetical protein AAMO2058_000659000 [Amorphochlora amoebiformis]
MAPTTRRLPGVTIFLGLCAALASRKGDSNLEYTLDSPRSPSFRRVRGFISAFAATHVWCTRASSSNKSLEDDVSLPGIHEYAPHGLRTWLKRSRERRRGGEQASGEESSEGFGGIELLRETTRRGEWEGMRARWMSDERVNLTLRRDIQKNLKPHGTISDDSEAVDPLPCIYPSPSPAPTIPPFPNISADMAFIKEQIAHAVQQARKNWAVRRLETDEFNHNLSHPAATMEIKKSLEPPGTLEQHSDNVLDVTMTDTDQPDVPGAQDMTPIIPEEINPHPNITPPQHTPRDAEGDQNPTQGDFPGEVPENFPGEVSENFPGEWECLRCGESRNAGEVCDGCGGLRERTYVTEVSIGEIGEWYAMLNDPDTVYAQAAKTMTSVPLNNALEGFDDRNLDTYRKLFERDSGPVSLTFTLPSSLHSWVTEKSVLRFFGGLAINATRLPLKSWERQVNTRVKKIFQPISYEHAKANVERRHADLDPSTGKRMQDPCPAFRVTFRNLTAMTFASDRIANDHHVFQDAKGFKDLNSTSKIPFTLTSILAPSQDDILAGDDGFEKPRSKRKDKQAILNGEGVCTTLSGRFSYPNFTTERHNLRDGMGWNARMGTPSGIAVAKDGTIYVSEEDMNRILTITPTGRTETLIKCASQGHGGRRDGSSGVARFGRLAGLGLIQSRRGVEAIIVADAKNNKIRRISADGSQVTTVAGGRKGFRDGVGSLARFKAPSDVAVTSHGAIYVADSENSRVRVIQPNGEVTTIAGSENPFAFADGLALPPSYPKQVRPVFEPPPLPRNLPGLGIPRGLALHPVTGDIYIACTGSGFLDRLNNRLRRYDVRTKTLHTVAGDGECGYRDGTSSTARFGQLTSCTFVPAGAFNSDIKGGIVCVDSLPSALRCVDLDTGRVTTIAGGGPAGWRDGRGRLARLAFPTSVAMDPFQHALYITDSGSNRIRRLAYGLDSLSFSPQRRPSFLPRARHVGDVRVKIPPMPESFNPRKIRNKAWRRAGIDKFSELDPHNFGLMTFEGILDSLRAMLFPSVESVRSCLRALHVLQTMDQNQDGNVELSEFLWFLHNILPPSYSLENKSLAEFVVDLFGWEDILEDSVNKQWFTDFDTQIPPNLRYHTLSPYFFPLSQDEAADYTPFPFFCQYPYAYPNHTLPAEEFHRRYFHEFLSQKAMIRNTPRGSYSVVGSTNFREWFEAKKRAMKVWLKDSDKSSDVEEDSDNWDVYARELPHSDDDARVDFETYY